jgi:hypothetical protein
MKNTLIDITKLELQVNTELKRQCNQSKFIEQGKLAPIYPDYVFSNIGLMSLVGKMDQVKQTTCSNTR